MRSGTDCGTATCACLSSALAVYEQVDPLLNGLHQALACFKKGGDIRIISSAGKRQCPRPSPWDRNLFLFDFALWPLLVFNFRLVPFVDAFCPCSPNTVFVASTSAAPAL